MLPNFGLRARFFSLLALLGLVAPLSTAPLAEAAILPTGFIEEPVVANLDGPVAMKWMPDGRIIILEQAGIVKIADPASGLDAQVVLDISDEVNGWNDRGLLGVELHPSFPVTPEMFLLYTYDPPETMNAEALYDGNDGPDRRVEYGEPDAQGQRVSRLVRWELDAGTNFTTVVANSDVVLLGENSTWANIGDPYSDGRDIDQPWACAEYDQPGDPNTSGTPIEDCLPGDALHTIGTLRFAPDGMLFVGMGDGASPDSIDPRSLRAQDIDTLAGKILRIDPDNGRGPSDNPFFDDDPSSNRSRVYQFGLRNPFRFTVDPVSGAPIIGDVGWNLFEEINTGPAGADFGWPCFEGGLADSVMAAGDLEGAGVNRLGPGFSQLPDCAADIAANTATPPIWAWCHLDAHPNCVQDLASSYAGAVTVGTNYPPEYRGLWFGDIYGPLKVMDLNTGLVTQVSGDIGFPVDMSLGPDGNIYFVSAISSSIIRVVYAPSAELCQGETVTVDISLGQSPTSGPDVILGTPASETIDGLAGDDLICGGGGDDLLYGGDGDDRLYGEDGLDYLQGDVGIDEFFGGPGRDYLQGGPEGEVMNGGAGDDIILGFAGDDTLNGGPDSDYLWGGDGVDVFNGDEGVDHLEGGAEGEVMNGGAGDDIVLGHDGDDTLIGEAGSDYLWGGEGIDSFDGGDDRDTLDGNDSQGAGEVMDGGAGQDDILAWGGDDTLIGGIGSDYLWGSEGNDTFDGGEGDDTLDGGAGDDEIDGGLGNDFVLGHDGVDTLLGGGGSDYLWGGFGIDSFDGGPDADFLDGGGEGEMMIGGSGDDSIVGRAGDDSLFGGLGVDFCSTGTGNDSADISCEVVSP